MSNDTNDDFRQELQSFAEDVLKEKPHCTNEDETEDNLVSPFVNFLGYKGASNVKRQYQIRSSNYKSQERVDYVILRNDKPVIVIEGKSCTNDLKDYHRAQLRCYFDAGTPDVKIGVLTNGIIYEFYTDIDDQNKMDSKPFLEFNLCNIANGQIDKFVLDALQDLRKLTLAPEELKKKAVKGRSIQNIAQNIEKLFYNPNDDFVRLLVQKDQKDPTEDKKLVKEALDVFLEARCKSLVSQDSEEDEENSISVDRTGIKLSAVFVNGRLFESTLAAFRGLGLPEGDHEKFRKELKKEGSCSYEKNGEKFHFETIEAHELKKLVSQGFCSIGTVVFDKDHRHEAKITDQGTLQNLHDEKRGIPSTLAAALLNKNNHNGWSNFWHVNYEGREIPLSELRAIAAESLKKI